MSLDWRRIHLPLSASTQEDVARLAEAGEPAGAVVRADVQTRGRGRGERAWTSPRGGLWFSVLLRPQREGWGLLPLLAGASVAASLGARGVDARVKWPNDVLVDGRKVCGVLLSGRTGADPHAVLGVGVNANVDLEELPEGVRARATTLQRELGHAVDLDELLEGILDGLAPRLQRWERGEDEALVGEWERLAWGLGTRVELPPRGAEGTAEGVTMDGALRVVLGEAGGGEGLEGEGSEVVHVTDGEEVRWLEMEDR